MRAAAPFLDEDLAEGLVAGFVAAGFVPCDFPDCARRFSVNRQQARLKISTCRYDMENSLKARQNQQSIDGDKFLAG